MLLVPCSIIKGSAEAHMTTTNNQSVPILQDLPISLRRRGAIDLKLEQGVLIFRVSQAVQNRIETLLRKQRKSKLTPDEDKELQQYEDVDDYLSLLNRLSRNLVQGQ
jgi:hypothetical protein